MPEPDWAQIDYDPTEPPHVGAEIIGRGPQSRKTKTWLPDIQIATQLGFIRGHAHHLMELFRTSHAKHYTVHVEVEDANGKRRTEVRPQVLSDAEVRRWYPVVAEWERIHQEFVEHYASIKGFSVKSATGDTEDNLRTRRDESSAGTDRRRAQPQQGEQRWR